MAQLQRQLDQLFSLFSGGNNRVYFWRDQRLAQHRFGYPFDLVALLVL